MGSTISVHNELIPMVGQLLNGTVDHAFAFHKFTTDEYEGTFSASPSRSIAVRQAVDFVSYIGSYDARMAYGTEKWQRPVLYI